MQLQLCSILSCSALCHPCAGIAHPVHSVLCSQVMLPTFTKRCPGPAPWPWWAVQTALALSVPITRQQALVWTRCGSCYRGNRSRVFCAWSWFLSVPARCLNCSKVLSNTVCLSGVTVQGTHTGYSDWMILLQGIHAILLGLMALGSSSVNVT